MDNFKKNLQSLKSINSPLFDTLQNITPNENLEVFIGRDPLDINFLDKTNNKFLFLDKSLEFNFQKLQDFNAFNLYPYLYFFGLGNGVFYELLLNNTNLKRLIIVEPNAEIIFSVLNLFDFSKDIEKRRLVLFYSKDLGLENLSPYFYMNKNALIYSKLYDLHIFNSYYEIYRDELFRVNKLFIDIIEHGVVSIGNDLKDAITGIKHHIANIPLMLVTPSLVELAKKAKNTNIAVIVSTGPSLYKQLSLLKKYENYISIFCIDASFPILSKYDIKPDIVLSLERVEESAKFYEVVDSKYFKDVIFEVTSIAHKKLVDTIKQKGGILQISQRPFGYTSYFELNEYGYIGIGMSAANMAYELVVHSGFETCVLIGQDLSFGEDGSSHSKDAVYGEREIAKKEQVLLPKYGGDGFVESTQVWKLFWNFFVKDIFDTKDRIKVINATEGGARIPYTIEMSFVEALNNIDSVKKPLITLDYPSKEIMQTNYKKAQKKANEFIKYGEGKKKKIEELFLKIAAQSENLLKLNKENKLDLIDFQKIDELNDEIEKIKGLFNSKKFIDMFNEATQAFIFHQEMEIAKIIVKIAKSDEEIKAKKIEWLLAHKEWLFYLAGCIDSVLFCIKESLKEWN